MYTFYTYKDYHLSEEDEKYLDKLIEEKKVKKIKDRIFGFAQKMCKIINPLEHPIACNYIKKIKRSQ